MLSILRAISEKQQLAVSVVGGTALLSSFLVACILGEPVPQVFDEFGYLLTSNTFANGRLATTSPSLPEFFESFAIIVDPVYAGKVFPGQGVFLAIGERLTGHPVAGVWLTSALFCAAICWMLQAWSGRLTGLLGGFLMIVQFGALSHWSQTYWGGAVSALGGALVFGAARRLWNGFSMAPAVVLGTGVVILASSRPAEGMVTLLPISGVVAYHLSRGERERVLALLRKTLAPAGFVVATGIAALLFYNQAVTGSAWKSPYMLHEAQYQRTPLLTVLPLREKRSYSSFWLRYYYEVFEMRMFQAQRTPYSWLLMAAEKIVEWWLFYCGLLTVPLVWLALRRRSPTFHIQLLFVCALGLAMLGRMNPDYVQLAIVFLCGAGWVLLSTAMTDIWHRIALGSCGLCLAFLLLTKWGLPHYFAPAASLLMLLQVEGLRQLWHSPTASVLRRGVVACVIGACVCSLGSNVLGRVYSWRWRSLEGSVAKSVLAGDNWATRRAALHRWFETQDPPQLVFVRYSPSHSVNQEWVYNHADLLKSHVIWARDLGREHNEQLIRTLPNRVVWLLEADTADPLPSVYPSLTDDAAKGPRVRGPTGERVPGTLPW
jgi:hypothetical protein